MGIPARTRPINRRRVMSSIARSLESTNSGNSEDPCDLVSKYWDISKGHASGLMDEAESSL